MYIPSRNVTLTIFTRAFHNTNNIALLHAPLQVNIANCLRISNNIIPHDTRDAKQRERFHPFTPGTPSSPLILPSSISYTTICLQISSSQLTLPSHITCTPNCHHPCTNYPIPPIYLVPSPYILFRPFTIGQHMDYQIPKTNPDWYPKYNPWLKEGYDCCAPDSISFHYSPADTTRQLYNYLYHCENKHNRHNS